VLVADPQAESPEAEHEYGVTLTPFEALPPADALVAAVAHREFLQLAPATLAAKLRPGGAFIDVKAAFDASALQAAGLRVWRL
jgi:UDP-N-acetyl-D-galactosamine dehydrogenase